MKLEFSRHSFEKRSDIKFNENPSSESRVVPCGRTDRHDEANIPDAFRNFSKAPTNCARILHLSAYRHAHKLMRNFAKPCQFMSNQTKEIYLSNSTLTHPIYIKAAVIYGAYDRCHFEYLEH